MLATSPSDLPGRNSLEALQVGEQVADLLLFKPIQQAFGHEGILLWLRCGNFDFFKSLLGAARIAQDESFSRGSDAHSGKDFSAAQRDAISLIALGQGCAGQSERFDEIAARANCAHFR